MSAHYWRIHGRVTRRLWSDLPERIRHIIASDVAHETPEFQWFEKKVNEDALVLFNDPDYYDNDPWTFKVSKRGYDLT